MNDSAHRCGNGKKDRKEKTNEISLTRAIDAEEVIVSDAGFAVGGAA
jgi:hypothetical protein